MSQMSKAIRQQHFKLHSEIISLYHVHNQTNKMKSLLNHF